MPSPCVPCAWCFLTASPCSTGQKERTDPTRAARELAGEGRDLEKQAKRSVLLAPAWINALGASGQLRFLSGYFRVRVCETISELNREGP